MGYQYNSKQTDINPKTGPPRIESAEQGWDKHKVLKQRTLRGNEIFSILKFSVERAPSSVMINDCEKGHVIRWCLQWAVGMLRRKVCKITKSTMKRAKEACA